MHNFPFLPTHSCVSEAWRSALVNQGFLQQQDPIRPRWRPRGQLGGQAWGIQALCWTPEETKGLVQEKVQRTQAGSLRDANMLKDLGEVPLHPVLTLSFPFTLQYTQIHIFVLFCFFPSDVPIHTSFNNLSPKHTDIPTTLCWCLLTGERVCEGGVKEGCWWKVAQAHGMWSGLHICRKDETGLPILQWWCQPAYMTVCGWGAKFLLFCFVFFCSFSFSTLFSLSFLLSVPFFLPNPLSFFFLFLFL